MLHPLYLEAEGLGTETLLDSALTMYAAEGKVYGIPAGVMAETLMAYGGETVGRGEWTMEAFLTNRSTRGGSNSFDGSSCPASHRSSYSPGFDDDDDIGFRVALYL